MRPTTPPARTVLSPRAEKTVKTISDLFQACLPALLLTALALFPHTARAQSPRASVPHTIPISITADTMTYEPDKDRVVFKGNVEASRAEFVMWSELLTMYLKPSGKKAADPARPGEGTEGETPARSAAPMLNPGIEPGDLDRIVAEKNVRFRYNTQSGTAGKATYTIDTGVLVLDGEPVLRDGENSITGNRIFYFLNENRSEVESGPKRRVEAIFGSGAAPGKN